MSWPVWLLPLTFVVTVSVPLWSPFAGADLLYIPAAYQGFAFAWLILTQRGRRIRESARLGRPTEATSNLKFACIVMSVSSILVGWVDSNVAWVTGTLGIIGSCWALTSTIAGRFIYEGESSQEHCPRCRRPITTDLIPLEREVFFQCPNCEQALTAEDLQPLPEDACFCPSCLAEAPSGLPAGGDLSIPCLECDAVAPRRHWLNARDAMRKRLMRRQREKWNKEGTVQDAP